MAKIEPPEEFTPTPDDALLALATCFEVGFCGEKIYITRYSNHNQPLANGGWAVASWRSGGPWSDSTNVYYLSIDQVWRYKSGSTFASAREAADFLQAWACRPGTNGWYQRAVDKHDPIPADANGSILS